MRRFKKRHLTASDCEALNQSREGVSSLTQPFCQGSCNQNSRRNLYPVHRRKKNKKGGGRQSSITEYFRHTSRSLGLSANMPGSQKIKAEEPLEVLTSQEGDFISDEDFCSFLDGDEVPEASRDHPCFSQDVNHSHMDDAHWDQSGSANMPGSQKIKAEEPLELLTAQEGDLLSDEDFCSFFDGDVVPEASRKQPFFPQDVNHSQMDDAHWDQSGQPSLECPLGNGKGKQVVEVLEIDPLPDACFGLFGTASWVVPQGCIDQLPDEVLQEIFALVPAADLYQSLSLVCHRWHRIISDPQFIPWKKLYHQYLKKESAASLTVMAIMEKYSLYQVQNESILGFIRCVAAIKSQRCRDPEAILRGLKSHSLFPMAQHCVIERLPDLQSPQALYVWAMISVIVLLSRSIWEFQELVSVFRRPSSALSTMDIMEALYCMAILLYAMREKEIRISNRIHYNIFSYLYLIENANCSPVIAVPKLPSSSYGRGIMDSTQPEIHPTCEQQQILNHAVAPGQVVKIMAFAGTGKTSTLVKYAEKWSHLKFLYLAFNKTIAMQGTRAFPWNVTCKTVHSLAFAEVGKNYMQRGKLSMGSLSSYWVSLVLQNRKGQNLFIRAKMVVQTLSAFLASADESISLEHAPIWCQSNQQNVLVEAEEKRIIVEEANQLWRNMKMLTPTREMAYRMTHDGYLKLWQLQKPSLSHYDAIFVDEAQDCTPAIMDIVLSQPCSVILVGDPHQQIYTFRGAVNALVEVPHSHIYYLTLSFRFGPEIAYVGATILDICKNVQNKTLVGSNQDGDVTGINVTGKVARLSRNNYSVFVDAVNVTNGEAPAKIHILGGLPAFGLEKIHDIWKLLRLELKLEIKDPFIRRWVKIGFAGLKGYASKAEDKQLEMIIAIVEKYRDRIPQLVERISRQQVPSQEMADFVLGTVHKAKGMEFDTVQITDDFVQVPFAWHNLWRMPDFSTDKVPEDEWNLLYVAVTRAKKCLVMPRLLARLLTLAGEYYLQPQLTSDVCKDEPIWCSVRGCCNSIPTESVLTMKKTPFVYSDGTRDLEVFLCHACVEQRLGPLVSLTASSEVVQTLEFVEEEGLDVPHVMLFLLPQF